MAIQVSVCVPTYNGATYLPACLESILAQTFSDFEILIVDDKSSDATVTIAQAYAKQDKRIRMGLLIIGIDVSNCHVVSGLSLSSRMT